MNRIFIDAKYNSNLELVSIGLVCEDNTSFYAELCNVEIEDENIENSLIFKDIGGNYKSEIVSYRKSLQIKGSLKTTLEYLNEWLSQFQESVIICKKKELKNLNTIFSSLNLNIINGRFRRTKSLYNALDSAKDLKNKFY